jgi:hypothetical protein
VVAALAFVAAPAGAAMTVEESWDYTDTTNNNGGTGWAAGSSWTYVGTNLTDNLTYTGVTSLGKAVVVADGSTYTGSAERGLASSIAVETPGTTWLGYLENSTRRQDQGSERDTQFDFNLRDASNNVVLQVYAKTEGYYDDPAGEDERKLFSDDGTTQIGSTYTFLDDVPLSWGTDYGTPNLTLVRIDTAVGADTLTLWLNPDLASFDPDTTPSQISGSATLSADIDDVQLYLTGANFGRRAAFDEVRMGDTWDAAAGVVPEPAVIPEPVTMILMTLAIGGLAPAVRRRLRTEGRGMMKNAAILTVCLALCGAGTAQAAQLVYEGCDYTADESFVGPTDWDPTGGKDGGTGWAEAWQGQVSRSPSVGTGLTYTDLPVVGGSAYRSSRCETERKLGQDALDQVTTNNTVWFSALVEPGDDTRKDFTARFYTTYSQSTVPWYNNRGIGFDLNPEDTVKASLGASRGAALAITAGDTNFILGKIEFGGDAGGGKISTTLTVWANPVIADGEAGLSGGSVVARDMGPAYESELGDYFGARGGGSWGGAFDEIRLGETFADVVPAAAGPIPEPVSALAVILGVGAVGRYVRRRRRA